MKRYNIETVCTTDDPIDSLEWHRKIRESGFEINVLPAWRPDKVLKDDRQYLDRLFELTGTKDLFEALRIRQEFFAENGCKIADHGLDHFHVDQRQIELFRMNYRMGWVQQFHFLTSSLQRGLKL